MARNPKGIDWKPLPVTMLTADMQKRLTAAFKAELETKATRQTLSDEITDMLHEVNAIGADEVVKVYPSRFAQDGAAPESQWLYGVTEAAKGKAARTAADDAIFAKVAENKGKASKRR
jgi:hypothetical protein